MGFWVAKTRNGGFERVGLAFERHLSLLHRLEQRRLRLRRRPIDLVGEQDVGEHRARNEAERHGALVEDRAARDVGGHQIGCELHACEGHRANLRERTGDQRLPDAGQILDQHMPIREHREEDQLERVAFADDRPLQFVEDAKANRRDMVRSSIV